MADVSVRVENSPLSSKLEADVSSGCHSLLEGAFNFGRGFGHQAAQPLDGINQIVTGRPGKNNAQAAAGKAEAAGPANGAVDQGQFGLNYTSAQILAGDFSHPLQPKPVVAVEKPDSHENSAAYKVGSSSWCPRRKIFAEAKRAGRLAQCFAHRDEDAGGKGTSANCEHWSTCRTS